MQVRLIQIKNREKARDLVCSFRRLACAWWDLPLMAPGEWWRDGPGGGPWMVKLYALVLRPRAGSGEPGGYELARGAVEALEERHGAELDWAAGFRASDAVWLLIKPWCRDRATGRKRWFAPGKDDLAAIRERLSAPGKAKKAAPRARTRGRG